MKHLLLSFLIAFTFALHAQDAAEPIQKNLNNGTVSEQFDYIIKNSNRYQEYKVVKRTWLDKLKSNVADSLNAVRKDLIVKQDLINNQQSEIEKLKADLAKTNEDLSKVSKEKDGIKFFGIPMLKSTYKTIMWAIAGILGLFLFIFIGRFARSKSVTAQTQKAHEELSAEFDAYRNKAMESEQKLRRKLQDEINKNLP